MVHRLRHLRPRHVALLAEAAWELTRASAELRAVATDATVRRLGTVGDRGAAPGATADQTRTAVGVGWAVTRAAGALPWHPSCLRQALAARRMLRRRGIPAEIHLGTTGTAAFAAHAWVVVGGRVVVGGGAVGGFVPLAVLH